MKKVSRKFIKIEIARDACCAAEEVVSLRQDLSMHSKVLTLLHSASTREYCQNSSHFIAIVACPLIVLISKTLFSPHPTEYFWVVFLADSAVLVHQKKVGRGKHA